MTKVHNFAGLHQSLPFTEFDFYASYRSTFEKTELGRMRRLLPLHELAENFGLVNKSMKRKRGRKSYFTPEGKVALMILKMYTQLSAPKLMEQLNGNVHYHIFCDIYIHPERPLTNYKLIDDVASELAVGLKIQQLQDILAKAWKPYMKNLDTMYTDATCYESEMLTTSGVRSVPGRVMKSNSCIACDYFYANIVFFCINNELSASNFWK